MCHRSDISGIRPWRMEGYRNKGHKGESIKERFRVRNSMERADGQRKRERGWWDYFNIQPAERCLCVSTRVFEPVRLLLIPPDPSFILPPLLSLHSLPLLLYPCLLHPLTPYLDRSHDCCDTSWLTAHLHVFQLHSLIRETDGGVVAEGPRYRWRGAVGYGRARCCGWRALGDWGALWEVREKREKPWTYRRDRKTEGKVK